jgi:hypothetical protein
MGTGTSAGRTAVAQSGDPERDALLATLAAADPRLRARATDLDRAMKRYAKDLPPTSANRKATLAAVARERKELAGVQTAAARATVTTPAGRSAQQLVLQSLVLHDQSLAKVDAGLRARFSTTSAKRFQEGRTLFDQALQRGINAKAALKRP